MKCSVFATIGLVSLLASSWSQAGSAPQVVIAEGEKFKPLDEKGWKVTHQDDSYASHSYGGMWVCNGGLLGAPADSVGAVATQAVEVPAGGAYRVWSKYQAPPYFNYLHQIEVVQNGKTVYSHTYGRNGTDRLWSFSGQSDELWWFWGVDHDAAEAPKKTVTLAKGPAEVRLTTVKNPHPAGDRMIDFVVLTTELPDTYKGFKPYRVGTPFAFEALAAGKVYLRFKNETGAAAQLSLRRAGHFQPNYGGASMKLPDQPVAAGQWSPWVNIAPFCRLVHDEGVWLNLPDAKTIAVQVARDAQGKDLVGDLTVQNGDPIVIPVDITWNKEARVLASREHARRIIQLAKTKWRRANNGKKPKQIAYYGAFPTRIPWVAELKDALGYNTLLPDNYEHLPCDGYHQHTHSIPAIKKYAETRIPDKKRFRVLSFGDEIHIGRINFKDPKLQEEFVAWLKQRGIGKSDLGVRLDDVKLADQGNPRIAWYAQIFSQERRFAHYRHMTQVAKQVIGPQVLTGANYSPHGMPQYYGALYQWIDIFKHNGMTLFWTEDYIFSITQPPQYISWMFAMMRCAVKYNKQPIHFYVMPHAPGQLPEYLRRNMVLSIGYGAAHIDNFWVAPAENFTENFVAWGYTDTFRVLHESIFDSAEAEVFQAGGSVRPGRVAIVLSKATDHNERRLRIAKEKDPFLRRCKNAPKEIQQILCRRDQQLLYLALKHAQQGVDCITEDDILEGYLKQYDVVYFAGEWIDHRAVPQLESWVKGGGALYATAGLGHRNQFGEPYDGLLKLLGLKSCTMAKNVYVVRPYLELPLVEPIDTITMDGQTIPAIGMRQELVPTKATVVGTWANGRPAVTVRELGKGKAFAVGTLPGHTYLKTGVRLTPWARGGRKMVYNPTGFDPAATKLACLAVEAKKPRQEIVCSNKYVEGVVIDHPKGTLVTLTNWDNQPLKDLTVSVAMGAAPAYVRSVQQQGNVESTFADGRLTFSTDLEWADYFLLPKR